MISRWKLSTLNSRNEFSSLCKYFHMQNGSYWFRANAKKSRTPIVAEIRNDSFSGNFASFDLYRSLCTRSGSSSHPLVSSKIILLRFSPRGSRPLGETLLKPGLYFQASLMSALLRSSKNKSLHVSGTGFSWFFSALLAWDDSTTKGFERALFISLNTSTICAI